MTGRMEEETSLRCSIVEIIDNFPSDASGPQGIVTMPDSEADEPCQQQFVYSNVSTDSYEQSNEANDCKILKRDKQSTRTLTCQCRQRNEPKSVTLPEGEKPFVSIPTASYGRSNGENCESISEIDKHGVRMSTESYDQNNEGNNLRNVQPRQQIVRLPDIMYRERNEVKSILIPETDKILQPSDEHHETERIPTPRWRKLLRNSRKRSLLSSRTSARRRRGSATMSSGEGDNVTCKQATKVRWNIPEKEIIPADDSEGGTGESGESDDYYKPARPCNINKWHQQGNPPPSDERTPYITVARTAASDTKWMKKMLRQIRTTKCSNRGPFQDLVPTLRYEVPRGRPPSSGGGRRAPPRRPPPTQNSSQDERTQRPIRLVKSRSRSASNELSHLDVVGPHFSLTISRDTPRRPKRPEREEKKTGMQRWFKRPAPGKRGGGILKRRLGSPSAGNVSGRFCESMYPSCPMPGLAFDSGPAGQFVPGRSLSQINMGPLEQQNAGPQAFYDSGSQGPLAIGPPEQFDEEQGQVTDASMGLQGQMGMGMQTIPTGTCTSGPPGQCGSFPNGMCGGGPLGSCGVAACGGGGNSNVRSLGYVNFRGGMGAARCGMGPQGHCGSGGPGSCGRPTCGPAASGNFNPQFGTNFNAQTMGYFNAQSTRNFNAQPMRNYNVQTLRRCGAGAPGSCSGGPPGSCGVPTCGAPASKQASLSSQHSLGTDSLGVETEKVFPAIASQSPKSSVKSIHSQKSMGGAQRSQTGGFACNRQTCGKLGSCQGPCCKCPGNRTSKINADSGAKNDSNKVTNDATRKDDNGSNSTSGNENVNEDSRNEDSVSERNDDSLENGEDAAPNGDDDSTDGGRKRSESQKDGRKQQQSAPCGRRRRAEAKPCSLLYVMETQQQSGSTGNKDGRFAQLIELASATGRPRVLALALPPAIAERRFPRCRGDPTERDGPFGRVSCPLAELPPEGWYSENIQTPTEAWGFQKHLLAPSNFPSGFPPGPLPGPYGAQDTISGASFGDFGWPGFKQMGSVGQMAQMTRQRIPYSTRRAPRCQILSRSPLAPRPQRLPPARQCGPAHPHAQPFGQRALVPFGTAGNGRSACPAHGRVLLPRPLCPFSPLRLPPPQPIPSIVFPHPTIYRRCPQGRPSQLLHCDLRTATCAFARPPSTTMAQFLKAVAGSCPARVQALTSAEAVPWRTFEDASDAEEDAVPRSRSRMRSTVARLKKSLAIGSARNRG